MTIIYCSLTDGSSNVLSGLSGPAGVVTAAAFSKRLARPSHNPGGNPKSQTTNHKKIPSTNDQTEAGCFPFGAWNSDDWSLFVIWGLSFGICAVCEGSDPSSTDMRD